MITKQTRVYLSVLMSTAAFTAMATAASARQASAAAPSGQSVEQVEEIVVTGYRKSLQDATASKRESLLITDSIYAKDIGKFPDNNLAESLQRIPGVQIRRDVYGGEGTEIGVRGLGPSFTKVVLNGASVNVASDGGLDDSYANREVDLNLFPSELFTKLEISKSTSASQLEGGLATVNLRAARASDNKGDIATVFAKLNYAQSSARVTPTYGGVISKNWDKVSILAGIAVSKSRGSIINTFRSVGFSNANLTCAGCDNSQGNNFTFATSVPANAGNNLTPGAPLGVTELLALNPGLTGNQLTNALIPRLGASVYGTSDRDRATAIVSVEYRPSPDLTFALDTMVHKGEFTSRRQEFNWYIRNSAPASTGGVVPLNMKVDANNVVTSGTFANANYFLTGTNLHDKLDFVNVNPNMSWAISDRLKLDVQANVGRSFLTRDAFSSFVATQNNQGITVNYSNNGSYIPIIKPSVDFNNPNAVRWQWDNAEARFEKRTVQNQGARADLTFDLNDAHRVKVGVARDEASRVIDPYSFGYTAQIRTLIATTDIPSYLISGPTDRYHYAGMSQFVSLDLAKAMAGSNFQYFLKNAPPATFARNGVSAGSISEDTNGAYIEYTGRADVFGRTLRLNAGGRYFETDQTVKGPILINGVRSDQTVKTKYHDFLPAANASYDLADNLVLRAAASKTITRANPISLLPGINFTDPSGQTATSGNPNLNPYYSDNYDAALEFYTGKSSYIALTVFHKKVDGFIQTVQVQKTFKDLGIPFASLSTYQQTAITTNGGDNAPVFVSTPVNADVVKLNGLEFAAVQSLDRFIKGAGVNFSYTHISDGDTKVATAIVPNIYNLTAYYERDKISASLSYVYYDKRVVFAAPQNGLFLDVYEKERGQLDFSASYQLTEKDSVSLEATNITNARIVRYLGYPNLVQQSTAPGYNVALSWNRKF